MQQVILEACVETLKQAIQAENKGAKRIELCSNLDKDGLTPSLSLTKQVLDALTIPVKVMIRPKQGDFVYSESEFQEMKKNIEEFKSLGVYGVVFGLLNPNFTVHLENTKTLAKLAKPMNVCFHKAIDLTKNIVEETKALSQIAEVDAILTSGGKLTANDGIDVLNEMYSVANGKLKIVAAGKISNQNILELKRKLLTNEFHGKLIVGKLEENN